MKTLSEKEFNGLNIKVMFTEKVEQAKKELSPLMQEIRKYMPQAEYGYHADIARLFVLAARPFDVVVVDVFKVFHVGGYLVLVLFVYLVHMKTDAVVREQGGEDDCRQGNRTDERTRSSLSGTAKNKSFNQRAEQSAPLKT